MKKLWMLVLLVMMVIPFKVSATSPVNVSNIGITGTEEGFIGEKVNLKFETNFSNVGTEDYIPVIVMYEIIYDPQVLYATTFYVEDWDSEMGESSTGKYLVISGYEKNTSTNCREGKYCNNTSISVDFFIQKTDLAETSLKIGQVWTVSVKSSDLDKYLEELEKEEENSNVNQYIETNTQILNKTQNIKIKQNGVTNIQLPKSEISGNKVQVPPQITVPNGNSNSNQQQSTSSTVKSDNNYLKSITIDGYPIEFKRDQMKYEIKVENNIDKLNVIVEQEDEKATVEITGADPLKEEIQVKVTAENGSEQVYTIFVDSKEEKTEEPKKKKDIKKEVEKFASDPRTLIVGGIVIAIIIICLFISTHNGRKIDKMLDKM